MKKYSRYDKLFEKYQGLLNTKSGTKYEMLVALVFKLLDDKKVVIHDLRLIGESDTKSQIDVLIEESNIRKRVLIECKDYDISGKPVGIEIARGFWAVIDDIKPDKGIIITCNYFTRDAKKYAKSKGIKLAVLREFREEDKKGLILSININLMEQTWTNPRPHLMFREKQDQEKWNADLAKANIKNNDILKSNSIFIITPEGRFVMYKYLNNILNRYPKDVAGHVKYKIPIDHGSVEVNTNGEIPFADLSIEFDIIHKDYFQEMVSKKVAALILERIQEGDDIIFYGDDLERYTIDPKSGEVVKRT